MEQNFIQDLPAIWLVFADTYLDHKNAPHTDPDHREQSLIDLLCCYLNKELVCATAKQLYDELTLTHIASVRKILELWSQDLDLIYQARKSGSDHELQIRRIAQRFLQRIKVFENCTIIPNGLILTKHDEYLHENVSLAILKRQNSCIDWIQVDPGSAYHQRCRKLVGEKSNAYLEITEINPDNITEDWLYLLVGLKATISGSFFYKEMSLYECLLAHLNGKTVHREQTDEGFIDYSHTSPVHTWHVVDQSFRYLLQHFIGEAFHVVYDRLRTGFKLFLMGQTFVAYQDGNNKKIKQCHFLLQEMCRNIAKQALDQGTEEQKAYSLKLIEAVKAAIEEYCNQKEQETYRTSQVEIPHVSSLSFVAPNLINHTCASSDLKLSSLEADPVFELPNTRDDIIDYLQQLKFNFIYKLVDSNDIKDTALLSYGIETFFIEYLAKTDILQKSSYCSFSRDDVCLANVLKELAEIYYGCQGRLVKHFLSNLSYSPLIYAKNVVLQFFVYAAVAALNFRDQNIGPLLATYNLSVSMSETLSLNQIISHLVIEDARWLKVLIVVQAFFTHEKGRVTLFSYTGYNNRRIFFDIHNDAHESNIDIAFAYQLLQRDEIAYKRFIFHYRDLEDEKLNQKWTKLAYTDDYLPPAYGLLSKVAFLAKTSLTGFDSATNRKRVETDWSERRNIDWRSRKKIYYWKSIISFEINCSEVDTQPNSSHLTSYLLNTSSCFVEDPYERLIIRKDNIGKSNTHFLENEIIATQDKKPKAMDCIRYMHLGFLQSESPIKFERLYIALKQQQLDFNCKQESILIKQTLFEISVLMKSEGNFCSLLEWTVNQNPSLIHTLGLLCIEKARAMQYRLTQHNAIGNIIEVIVGLLTFYPSAFKDEFKKDITDIYHLLRNILAQPPSHLSDYTLLHLNTYLILIIQTAPELLKTETLTVLKALFAIQNYKVKGIKLENNLLLQMHTATFICYSWIEHQLDEDSTLLNSLMLNVIPQWDITRLWRKSKAGLLFTCREYAIKPLIGCIYFQNRPIIGLPDSITEHHVFKEYFGSVNFTVIPASREINAQESLCYLSVGLEPQVRLTLIREVLLIEEWIEGDYQQYIPAKELLGNSSYSQLLYQSPDNKYKLRHWLDNNHKILFKDQKGRIIYEWDLKSNNIFSLQHKEYVVPWEQLQACYFKTWLERVELPDWIELTAQVSLEGTDIQIVSLHFPRLGLHFDYRQSKFYSKQLHGYMLSEQQHINTLHGFLNYLVLENKEINLKLTRTKVVIPHRKVTPNSFFYDKKTITDRKKIKCPTYFVYDHDGKTGLLKAHNIRAHLYLALLYYCSASLDDHDASHCNAYHLARENLELSWKDQPYDEIELDIIEQLLSPETLRDCHSHRISLYLKVVSLLSCSLRLSFLYMDEVTLQNKEKSNKLLKSSFKYLPDLFSLYLQSKSTILLRVKLNFEEEEDILIQCLASIKREDVVKQDLLSFEAYNQLCFEKQSEVSISTNLGKAYKHNYRQLFSKEELRNTSFSLIFEEHLHYLSFSHDTKKVDFSFGINKIVIDRFRLMHFITLYKLAKTSNVTLAKYRYLLHYMVLRAKINYESFPELLVMMLARVLLLVAENPTDFPESPRWFLNGISIDLFKRDLTYSEILASFPSFYWIAEKTYDTYDEERKAREKAEKVDREENQQIVSYFMRYDLNSHGIARCLPENLEKFTLQYESYIIFSRVSKRDVVRTLYLQSAYNNAMYEFFVSVLEKCDKLKTVSTMGWPILPFIRNSITVTIASKKATSLPTSKQINLQTLAAPQQPLIDMEEMFTVSPHAVFNRDFLFETHLKEPGNGYQRQFYSELKDSWSAYRNEMDHSYSWHNTQSLGQLESVLQTKYYDLKEKADQIWAHIATQLKQRPNSEADQYFALRWHSGQVLYYHKGDIITLLVEPHKLESYNPVCLQKQDSIVNDLLHYVNYEINADKIVRVFILIEQYKEIESQAEKFSLLQNLVNTLEENLDIMSYCYPHWLLFQFENEIIVRNNQQELIVDMLNQTEKAMYQLNMGEGKSSVILPLLSCNLANGQQILRINVLSALLVTMKDFLRQRFSGLIKKHVYTLPFYRDTDISMENLTVILHTLNTCQLYRHILLVTPEHRLCLQLKVRELMIENQQQIGATNIFNWKTYRQRVRRNFEVYEDLTEIEIEELREKQDQRLRLCLCNEKYINSNDRILKVPPRGQKRKEFSRFKEIINDVTFREWSCLKAAYRELLYNSTLAHADSCEKLSILNKINSLTAVDLLDESDEILKHGTELNYSLGDKQVFAGEALRWQIPQFFIKSIFCDLALKAVITAGKTDGFTVINESCSRGKGVPFIQLLSEYYYENHIKPLLIEMFFAENLPTLRKYHISADKPLLECESSCLKHYIAGQLSLNAEKKVMAYLADKGTLKDKLLIAKGWISHGILFHVFNAKYRVQFGLNLNVRGQIPKQIAIPFWGKDTPSPRSEFSHPDVMLGFTIISYLYHGLDEQQLKKTLLKLKAKYSNQVADIHLKCWAEVSRAWIELQTDKFPPLLLTSFEHMDLADERCLMQVHQYLSGNYLAIFFYLNQFVFVDEGMQYLHKISANAHSLVGYNSALGFSGTDDRKITMPFQIKSLRSKTQEGTNGKLLFVLTQDRNSCYYSLISEDATDLLKQLCHYIAKHPNCHALIDAGALITGITNCEVASFLLLHLPPSFLGVLYFNDEENNLTVLTKDEKTTPLQDCYLDKQYLFAYLDDIHTRGTDIKLPLNCHAILTIGMGMQKDKFMQAAMRLRQLAQKQSVSLWGTQTVTLAIARDNSVNVTMINSREVIKWVTRNTIEHINSDLFHVAVRKINFQFLRKAEDWLKDAPTRLDSLFQYCQDKELFLLEEFYALSPQLEDLSDRLHIFVSVRIKTFWQELKHELQKKQLTHTAFYKKIFNQSDKDIFKEQIYTICNELAVYLQEGFVHGSLDDDEEKEVEVEIIQEQEVVIKIENRNPRLETEWDVRLILQQDFIVLAKDGIIIPLNSIKKFIQVPNLKNIVWHPNIYMTTNFLHSIESTESENLDNYLRPVDVVLIHRVKDQSRAVLLSGQEASKIKLACYKELDNNLLVHINDINGTTQLPINSIVNKKEEKLLTIIKLFAGECNYSSLREVQRLAKRVGRIYPHYFVCSDASVDRVCSENLYGILIEKGYLDFSGVMTSKLLNILIRVKRGESPDFELIVKYQQHSQYLLKKLDAIYTKLIIQPSNSLKDDHYTLWQWVGTRGRLKEYSGSSLESIIDSEYELKFSP